MKDNSIFSNATLLLLLLLFTAGCDVNENGETEHSIPTLAETLSAICARKAYSDSLQARFEVDTLARVFVEHYMIYDSSFAQNIGDFQRELENLYRGPVDWKPIAIGIKLNLDEDEEEEIICFLGSFYSSPHIMVFDNVDDKYTKVLDEYLWLHNEHPRLKILNIKGKNIFRTGKFYYRGSGRWLYAYQCYGMTNGGIRQLAEFPYRANFSLGGPIMSTCNLKSDSIIGNNYALTYSYSAKVSNQFFRSKQDSTYREFEIVEDDPLVVTYALDTLTGDLLPDDGALVTQLMNFENDTCAFELIEPYLKAKDRMIYKFFKAVFGDARAESFANRLTI